MQLEGAKVVPRGANLPIPRRLRELGKTNIITRHRGRGNGLVDAWAGLVMWRPGASQPQHRSAINSAVSRGPSRSVTIIAGSWHLTARRSSASDNRANFFFESRPSPAKLAQTYRAISASHNGLQAMRAQAAAPVWQATVRPASGVAKVIDGNNPAMLPVIGGNTSAQYNRKPTGRQSRRGNSDARSGAWREPRAWHIVIEGSQAILNCECLSVASIFFSGGYRGSLMVARASARCETRASAAAGLVVVRRSSQCHAEASPRPDLELAANLRLADAFLTTAISRHPASMRGHLGLGIYVCSA